MLHRSIGWLLALSLALGCASAPTPKPPAAPTVPTSAQAGATTIVAVAPAEKPCCPPPSIWDFLGVKQVGQVVGGIFGRIRNRLGMRFPGLEAKPAVLAITDPANLESPNPAVQAAAAVKADEDAAAQKVKALRYLATIGCGGCYPDVEAALLAGLDDCTEDVRYEAAKAFRTAAGNPCAKCKTSSCCSPKVQKRLREVVDARDDQGCYKESSARVRRMARLALADCGGEPALAAAGPTEGPSADAPAEGADEPQTANGASPAATARRKDGSSTARQAGTARQARTAKPVRTASSRTGTPTLAVPPAQPADCPHCRAGLSPHENHSDDDQNTPADSPAPNSPAAIASAIAVVTAEQPQKNEGTSASIAANETPIVYEAEIAAYYHENQDRFQRPGRVRGEMLSAPFAQFPSRDMAYQALATARLRDAATTPPHPAIQVKPLSWSERAHFPSQAIAESIFGTPLGRVSPIWADEQGWHAFRVLERQRGTAIPLSEVSDDIYAEIVRQRTRANALR